MSSRRTVWLSVFVVLTCMITGVHVENNVKSAAASLHASKFLLSPVANSSASQSAAASLQVTQTGRVSGQGFGAHVLTAVESDVTPQRSNPRGSTSLQKNLKMRSSCLQPKSRLTIRCKAGLRRLAKTQAESMRFGESSVQELSQLSDLPGSRSCREAAEFPSRSSGRGLRLSLASLRYWC